MRDLVVTQNITLDGVIDAASGFFAPAAETDLHDVTAALAEQRERADGFLTGRTTFEQMRGYWPAQTDDTSGISDYLNRVRKYVVSTTLEDADWEPTTILRDLDGVATAKAEAGGDIVATGSITLVHALLRAGLVDELRLFAYPTAVGTGRRLFPDGFAHQRFDLVEQRAFVSGITLQRYRLRRERGASGLDPSSATLAQPARHGRSTRQSSTC